MLTNAMAGGLLGAAYLTVLVLQLNPQVPTVSLTALGWFGALGTLSPRRGFLEGFFNPMAADPYMGLRRIIHYDPSRGQSSNNTDDAIMEDFGRMDEKKESLKGLTMEQRISRTRVLLGGNARGARSGAPIRAARSNARAKAVNTEYGVPLPVRSVPGISSVSPP